ncbi:MAG TPA: BTAD domain-containing putative transcriptional regulator, partial [Anaerolineae bacterium]|nr:BTAD domain-containing putative transcriptional regulator [Anaerolineae bacterium]
MDETLRVRLLGGFRLVHGDVPVEGLDAPRLQSLVAYLLLHREGPQPRRHLAFLLWPDSDESQARTNLRNLLHYLRRALPEAARFVRLDAQALQWRPDAPYVFDVAEFERAACEGRLEEAAALYAGDLLPDCYDDWIIPERERLQALSVDVLRRLLQRLEQAGDYRAASEQARRLIQCDPLREEPYRDLMRLYALNGDRAAAVHVYHTCADTLQRELGVEPGPATRQAYERLLSAAKDQGAAVAQALPGTLPLVGRAQEWAQLLAAWRAASDGQRRFVALQGEAGIGKTRLVEELIAWAGRQGLLTASANCYAPASSLAYAPVAAWLRARPLPTLQPLWLSEVARLLPELLAQRPDLPEPGPLAEEWQRQRLYAALARAVLTGPQPLLLVIEDVQWCDADTLAWLHYLMHCELRARFLVLATLRLGEVEPDGPLAALSNALRHEQLLTEIELARLDEAETATLARHVAGRELPAGDLAQLYQETEGNPLFVVETVRCRGGSGTAPGPAVEDGLRTAPTVPPRVQAVLAARLEALTPAARELLGVAAVVGREFTFDVLQRASGGSEEALVRALDELWQRRIVRERGQHGYDFGHQRLREVAYEALSAARRRLLHRRVAEAVEAVAPDRAGTLAYHLEQAQDWERATHYHRLAGEEERRVYAHEAALAHFDQALNLAGRAALGAEARFEILAAREAVLEVLGQREAQARDLQAMAALAREVLGPARLAQVYRRQAQLLTDTGRYDEAEAAAQQAVALAEEDGAALGRAAALVALGNVLDLRGDPARAIPHLRAAVALCDAEAEGGSRTAPTADGARQQSAAAHYALASALVAVRDYDAGRAEAEAALALYEALGDRLGQTQALNILGIIGMEQGAFDGAVSCYRRALDICRTIGYRYGEARALGNMGNIFYVGGQLGEALARYDDAAAIFRAIGHRRGETIVRLNTADIRLTVFGDAVESGHFAADAV